MDDNERALLRILGQELNQSAGGNENEFIDSNRKAALATYLGQKTGKEVEGRSQVISTDVADAIEWIMPEVMEQITRTKEVITFDPINADDEDQAALESQYCYDILMKENPGFIILHQVVKDSLMQKNGFVKCNYETFENREIKEYTGLNEAEIQYLINVEKVEITAQEEYPDEETNFRALAEYQAMARQYQMQAQQMQAAGQVPPPMAPPPEPVSLYDVRVARTKRKSKIAVCAIPPEEFRINRQHNSPDPTTARFCAHVSLKTASELIKSGIPKEIVDSLPTGEQDDDDRDYRFYMQNETVYPTREVSDDPSQFMYEIAECYLWYDYNNDGKSEFCKIEVAGGDNPTHILRIQEISISDHPFRSFISIMMSHKFFGLSIYDRLRELQEQKTSLLRNTLDNLYLQNNQRVAVLEGQVNLDDLLVSRPGGIVRQSVMGAVEPIVTPAVGQDAYNMMEYLDKVRAGRVGVNPEGPLEVDNIGDRVGSEGVAKLMAAREAVVSLIVRVLAETGLKPLLCLIRDQARNHIDTIEDYNFRNSWRAVKPTDWPERTRSTPNVGTGSSNNLQQLGAVQQILEYQMALIQSDPMQTLVTPDNQYMALKKFCILSGLGPDNPYFLDPRSDEGQQNAEMASQQQQEAKAKEEQMQMAMMQMQGKLADAEMGKAKAEMQNVMLKGQLGGMENQLDEAKAIADNAQETAEMQFKYAELASKEAMKMSEIESKERIDITKIHEQNKAAVRDGQQNSGSAA